ncbi:nitroreductase family protein [Comamonas sp.]|uniref:nitroreductase family protein n=1 Tax=Comamonas sp. TaxID=34028 RepID=UPI003FA58231
MTISVQTAIASSISINTFQPNRPLDDTCIASLVDFATKAPSAYNLQNWRFVVARSQEAKARLQSAAYGQKKIGDASAAFVVCGTLEAHTQLSSALASSVLAGFMPPAMADAWQAQAHRSHEGNSKLQRDEAVRSCSTARTPLPLASLTLPATAMSLTLASNWTLSASGKPHSVRTVLTVSPNSKSTVDSGPTGREVRSLFVDATSISARRLASFSRRRCRSICLPSSARCSLKFSKLLRRDASVGRRRRACSSNSSIWPSSDAMELTRCRGIPTPADITPDSGFCVL